MIRIAPPHLIGFNSVDSFNARLDLSSTSISAQPSGGSGAMVKRALL
jgi:hypothetical protein